MAAAVANKSVDDTTTPKTSRPLRGRNVHLRRCGQRFGGGASDGSNIEEIHPNGANKAHYVSYFDVQPKGARTTEEILQLDAAYRARLALDEICE